MTGRTDISPLNAGLARTQPNANDLAPEILKTALSLIPVLGNIAGFVIDQRPAKQVERITDFLRILTQRVEEMAIDVEAFRERAAREEGGELFHGGLLAAAASTTHTKRVRLAAIVAEGLSKDEIHAANESRRLKIIATLDDFEFSLLLAMQRDGRVDYPYPDEYETPESVGGGLLLLSSEGKDAAPIALPKEANATPPADLLLALNRLIGLGLTESDRDKKVADKHYKSFWLTIAGAALVSECRP